MRLTDNKKRLDDHVTDHGRFVRVDETRIVRHHDGHVERCNQDQPVPARLENAVMRQHPSGFFQCRRLVLRQRRGRSLQQGLRSRGERRGKKNRKQNNSRK